MSFFPVSSPAMPIFNIGYPRRPTSNIEKKSIAHDFSSRLRSMFPYPLRIFLVGSVVNMRDQVWSDIDVRVLYSPHYGNFAILRTVAEFLARTIYLETGVWIDVKLRRNIPVSLGIGKNVMEI